MNFRRLLFWGDLEARRRKSAGRGLAALPAWAKVGLMCAAAFVACAQTLGAFGGAADVPAASNLVLVVLAAGGAAAALGAPFRMYWRHDAAMLARLPIPGRSLFALAWIRQLRATVALIAPAAVAALALLVWGEAAIAWRHVALSLAAFFVAGALAPAAALLAGEVAASDKAHEMIAGMAGEVAAPRTGWLGVLPGVVAAGLILLIIAGASWAQGHRAVTALGAWPVFLAVAVVPSVLAAAWALFASPRVMSRAAAEVAALDRQILAHVERVSASATERAWARLWLRDAGARAVYDKDGRLLRRRYPLATLAVFVAVGGLWLSAWQAPDSLGIPVAIFAGLCLSVVILWRRLVDAPLESPRLLRSLPVSANASANAKRALILLRVVLVLVAGGVPVIARAENPALSALAFGAIAVLTAATLWRTRLFADS